MAISSIPTGARCVFSINGKVLAYARSVAVSESIDYQPVECLNDLRIREFCPTAYRVTLSCEVVRLIGTTLKSMGFFAATAQAASTQLINILNTGDLVATIEDSVTGTVLATINGVKIASHSWSVDARGMVMESVEFVATTLSEESDAA
jgi:hypothetical protein